MKKILVSIGAVSAQMQSAVAEALAIYRKEGAQIHLLNVQTIVPGFAARYFSEDNLRELQMECGREELAPAKALLDAAGVTYVEHIRIGRSAPTIVDVAQELRCTRIVMGQAERVDFLDKLAGSLASQVRHLLEGTGNCSVIGA
jgi:nucleotide-binding universal stress UspA family protein